MSRPRGSPGAPASRRATRADGCRSPDRPCVPPSRKGDRDLRKARRHASAPGVVAGGLEEAQVAVVARRRDLAGFDRRSDRAARLALVLARAELALPEERTELDQARGGFFGEEVP